MIADSNCIAKILLVDDVEDNLVALEALLRAPGLQFLMARNGKEALELLLEHEVALALIDVQMPEMDGFTLAELMRGAQRTAHIPIIMVTAGSRDRERLFRGYEAGAVDFLFKPLEPSILLNKVATFVQLYRQRVELERTLRLNEMFMAVLSHDLRNPVGAVVTIAAVLSAKPSPTMVQQSAERLRSIGARMGRMINDLLDLARSRQGDGIPVVCKPTDLCALIGRVIDELRLVHPERMVAATLPEQPVVGDWDADRLAQLIENLIANAFEHGPPDRPVTVALMVPDTVAVLSVANEGDISPEALPQMFDPFRSGAERKPNSTGAGLGLGLYIVREIAHAHAGSVAAESANGVVTFTVRLPLAAHKD